MMTEPMDPATPVDDDPNTPDPERRDGTDTEDASRKGQ